jgi:aspartate kinase
VPEAHPIAEIRYEEMLELSTFGARVLHNRAVELGELYDIPILVAASAGGGPGTLIHGGVSMEVRNKVRGIAHDVHVAKVTIVGVPDRPGIAAAVFQPLAEAGVSVDNIVQNASIDNITDLTFTIAKGDLARAMAVVEPIAGQIGARQYLSDTNVGKISIIGTGMLNAPGYAAKMFSALSDKGINIQLITTSEIRITCIIDEARVKEAATVLHRAFELESGE